MKKNKSKISVTDTFPKSSGASKKRLRIGILLSASKKIDKKIIKYLVLQLNNQQSLFEFAFFPFNDSDYLNKLSLTETDEIRKEFFQAREKFQNNFSSLRRDYNLSGVTPNCWIVLTTSRREDNYYFWMFSGVAIIALGHWNKKMAPPSIIEFILVLMIQIAASFLWSIDSHIDTKGCFFDFTPSLNDARFKALVGYICEDCKEKIPPKKYKELKNILEMEWLGDCTKENTPASVTKKLGFNLFRTKSFKPKFGERLLAMLESEGIKELIKLIFMIIGTALLIFFGLKIIE